MKLRTNLLILILGFTIGLLCMYFIFNREKNVQKIEISHNMVMEKIEALGNLEVLKYSIKDVMEYKKVRQWLPNAKAALIISGEVIACIDLTKIEQNDIHVSGDSITLRLPSPEICHVRIDHEKSHIYNIEYGLWESGKIMDEAYRYAEKELYKQAEKIDFESKSRDNANNLLRPILYAMGFKNVNITFHSKSYTGK